MIDPTIIDPTIKEALGIAAPAVGLVGDAAYIWTILKGQTRPHAFSWIVWTLILAIVFCGQLMAHAGPGAWLTGYNTIFCAFVSLLAWRRGETEFTRGDRAMLAASLAGIPIWLLAHDPVWSVCLETVIGFAASWPTLRKTFHRPSSENAFTYLLVTVTFIMDLFAMDSHSVATDLFPVYTVFYSGSFFLMLLWRRHALRQRRDSAF